MLKNSKINLKKNSLITIKFLIKQNKRQKKIIDADEKTKVNRNIENKKNQFNLEIKKEIEKAEKEIKTLKLSSIERY